MDKERGRAVQGASDDDESCSRSLAQIGHRVHAGRHLPLDTGDDDLGVVANTDLHGQRAVNADD
tara:strand:+ start:265 stop:456 length:192 start_codon:yes stop_codon:yes gene_type:complete